MSTEFQAVLYPVSKLIYIRYKKVHYVREESEMAGIFNREPNSGNCLDLIFGTSPYEKVIIIPNKQYHICNQRIHVRLTKSW